MTDPQAMQSDAKAIAEGLSKAMRRIVLASPNGWFPAAFVTNQPAASAGSLLSNMAARGIYGSRSDPAVWGRWQYQFSPLGAQVRAILQDQANAE